MRNRVIPPDKFYDQALIAQIASKLGITDAKVIADLSAILEKSAQDFIWHRNQQSNFTQAQTAKKFTKLATYMQKAKKLYQDATEYSLSGSGDMVDALLKLDRGNPYRALLYELYTKDEYFLTPENLFSLLESLETAFLTASKAESKLHFNRWNKTELILSWIWKLDDFWEKNSKVPITEGKHTIIDIEKELTGNESPAMEIFWLMAEPINQYLPDWKITNSMIAQAIRDRRNPVRLQKFIDLSDGEIEVMFQ